MFLDRGERRRVCVVGPVRKVPGRIFLGRCEKVPAYVFLRRCENTGLFVFGPG